MACAHGHTPFSVQCTTKRHCVFLEDCSLSLLADSEPRQFCQEQFSGAPLPGMLIWSPPRSTGSPQAGNRQPLQQTSSEQLDALPPAAALATGSANPLPAEPPRTARPAGARSDLPGTRWNAVGQGSELLLRFHREVMLVVFT